METAQNDDLRRNDVEGAIREAQRLNSEGRLNGDLYAYLRRLQDDPSAFDARFANAFPDLV